jgi:hypothetical protein
MSRLELLDGRTVQDFVVAPAAVLMLGKSDCEACARWTEELEAFLEQSQDWPDVRFGKLLLDQGGLIAFKRANPWLAELDALPMNVIYQGGERRSTYPGAGASRLENRLRQILRPS